MKKIYNILTPFLVVIIVVIGFSSSLLVADNPYSEYAWTVNIGGSGEDHPNDIALDLQNNIFIVGRFTDTVDFDPTVSIDEHTSNGQGDIFLTKLYADGSYAWTHTFGGIRDDFGYGIAVDPLGDVIVTGWFRSTVDFDPTEGVDEYAAYLDDGVDRGYEDVFISKFTSDGSYVWTRTFGDVGSDRAHGITIDSNSDIIVTGGFYYSVDFDPTEGIDEHTSTGGYDIFATKLTSDGLYEWTYTRGSIYYDLGFGVDTDFENNILFTGVFGSDIDFDPGPDQDMHEDGGAFVCKLDSDGQYEWTRSVGTRDYTNSYDIVVDNSGDIIYAGGYRNSQDLDPTETIDWHIASNSYSDIFISKLYANGSYAWSYSAGASVWDCVQGLAVTQDGDVLATGYFQKSVDFAPEGYLSEYHESKGWFDIFMTKLHADGSYCSTVSIGDVGYDDKGHAIAINTEDDILLAGRFNLTVDFDPSVCIDEYQSEGWFDIFVTKIINDQ